MTRKKIATALLGFVAGIISIPLVMIAWPFVCAWFIYNETED